MENSAIITLKSGREVPIKDFEYITYPSLSDSKNITTVKTFENFYLYDRLLTFVGRTAVISLHSKDIEFVRFIGSFNE
ncbi:hypothetical protein JCM1393_00510 [Clostridium carnis]